MTTILSTSTHGIAHQGQMYVATLKTGCVLSTDADELIRTIKQHEETEHQKVFGDVATWTFVRSVHAANYYTWLESKSQTAPTGPTRWLGFTMIQGGISQETKDAADWIEQNAQSKVLARAIPGTDIWYWMFEDAQEAVLFRLTVTL